ncbi:glycosyltransferase family 2 protein [SAR202 cluster bacterium AD-804-J14_MRT_500m]|nr:glycosyltransferase family 2 protein [SAR202 cluster bacterium AD-804-J14_MRT_500m]
MGGSPFLSLVIPAYNEESRISDTITSVTTFLDTQSFDWELIIANDGSTDGTASIVQRYTKLDSRVKHLALTHCGKGWAVRNGMIEARGRYRFLCDADLSMPIEQLTRFLPPEGPPCEVVIASREAIGSYRFGEPWTRHLMGRIFNMLAQIIVLPGITDSQCGFKCFTDMAARRLFSLQRLNGFGFDVELLFLSRRLGIRIAQVPINWHYNSGGKVRPIQDSVKMIGDLLSIRWASFMGRYN